VFTSTPILKHFDPALEVIIKTDASNFAIGCILFQKQNGRLHPVAFHSRKMEPVERNYDIHDKELLAVVEVFKHWRPYCHGARFPILVLTDHQNLRYFTTSKVLNQRQVHWAEKLSEFHFRIVYRAGSKNRKLDALSRRSEYAVGGEGKPITLIKSDQIVIAAASMYPLLIKRLDNNAKIPIRGYDLAAGIDIMANQEMIIPPGSWSPISTGIA
jgi:hypothetical protein